MGGRERFCFVVLLGDGDQERRRHLCIHWNSDFLEERHCVFSFHIYRAQKRITSGSKPIKTRYLVCISDNGTQSIQLFKQQISRPSLLLLFSILLLHQSLEKYLQMVSFKKKKPKNKKPNKTKLSLLFKKNHNHHQSNLLVQWHSTGGHIHTQRMLVSWKFYPFSSGLNPTITASCQP